MAGGGHHGGAKGSQQDSTSAPNSMASMVPLLPSAFPVRLSSTVATPRETVIRSRVMMHRTADGPRGTIPPTELLPVMHIGGPGTTPGPATGGRLIFKSACLVGDGPLQVPAELVAAPAAVTTRKALTTKTKSKVFASVQSKKGAEGLKPSPEFSDEVQMEVKNKLNRLQQCVRVADLGSNATAIRLFCTSLQELCEMLDVAGSDKKHRARYSYAPMHALSQLMPPVVSADLPSSGDLPASGFIPSVLAAALADVPWEFTHNSLTHRVCDCGVKWPSVGNCLTPIESRQLSSRGAASPQAVAAAMAAMSVVQPTQTSRGGPRMVLPQDTHQRFAAAQHLLASLRRKERHLPTQLPGCAAKLQARFREFASRVPTLLEDLTAVGGDSRAALEKWRRFIFQFGSEASILDRYYTHFEEIFLDVADRMIGTALDAVHSMAGLSRSMCTPGDPFREVEAAVFCQRLGLLKRQVSFGSQHNLVHFDPALLDKARRVLQMDTYERVRDLAQTLLMKFSALCQALVNMRDTTLSPELSENAELRTAVLQLEEPWAECQFLLQQDVLNFVQKLLDFLNREVEAGRFENSWRRRFGIVLADDPADMVVGSAIRVEHASEHGYEEARVTFFETLPMLMYLDELKLDIAAEREGAQAEAAAGTCCFRDLFCDYDDRHQLLRRDFQRFDEQRFTQIRMFVCGVQEERDLDAFKRKYFRNMSDQLKNLAAFSSEASARQALYEATSMKPSSGNAPWAPMSNEEKQLKDQAAWRDQRALEARARWVCVHRVAKSVQPAFFQTDPREPGEKDKVRRRKQGTKFEGNNGEGNSYHARRRVSQVHHSGSKSAGTPTEDRELASPVSTAAAPTGASASSRVTSTTPMSLASPQAASLTSPQAASGSGGDQPAPQPAFITQ